MVGANSARACASASACAQIDEDHVAAGEQLGVRTEHRMQRGHRDAGRRAAPSRPARSGDFSEPRSNTTPRGWRCASCCRIALVAPSGAATTMKSCVQRRAAPVRDRARRPARALRIGDLDLEALRASGTARTSRPSCRRRRSPARAGRCRRPARRRSPAPAWSARSGSAAASPSSAISGETPSVCAWLRAPRMHVALAP